VVVPGILLYQEAAMLSPAPHRWLAMEVNPGGLCLQHPIYGKTTMPMHKWKGLVAQNSSQAVRLQPFILS